MESQAEVHTEERKQHTGRGRGGRGRGGVHKEKSYNHQDGEQKQGQNRRGQAPSEANKDSYYYKYHYGPWPN